MGDNIPLKDWSGSGATQALLLTIPRYNEVNARPTRQLIILTWAITVLTTLLLVGLGV